MRKSGLVFVLGVLLGCGHAYAQGTAANAARVPDRVPASVAAQRFIVAGHELRLLNAPGQCELEHKLADQRGPANRQTLGLQSPCYFLLWQHAPDKRNRGAAGGVPVGKRGEPEAWRFASAKNTIALLVVGDHDKSDPRYAWHSAAGYHCGTSLQGVLLIKSKLSLAGAFTNSGLHCAEVGTDQKMFWLAAHPQK